MSNPVEECRQPPDIDKTSSKSIAFQILTAILQLVV